MISFTCTSCGKVLKVKTELAGKRGKCPGCGQAIVAPMPDATRAPVARERTMAERDAEAPAKPPDSPSVEEQATLPPGAAARSADSSDINTVSPVPQGDLPSELTDFLAPPQAADELGRLGPYRILKVLGHGGMGVVYLAEDPQLERRVALKAMLPALAPSASARQRFLREARAAAAIKHDHIVTIFQVGEDRGATYLAMELLEGEPLDERLKRGEPLPVAETLRIARQTAEGLAAAHDKGMIHRDIKPANIWLEKRPESRGESREPERAKSPALVSRLSALNYFRVKILDFGLARAAGAASELTQQGAIIGTPAYMAPEQATGQDVDARADLFSLGCVLYRMCTGAAAFKGRDTVATLMSVASDTPPEPRKLNKEVSQQLSDLVMALLEKDPARRPASAHEVAEALRTLGGESTAPLPGLSRRRGSRRKFYLAFGGAAASLAVAVVLFLVLFKTGGPNKGGQGDTTLFGGKLSPDELALAGGGDPRNAPKALVGVLGKTAKEKSAGFRALAITKDGATLTSVDNAGAVKLWDLGSGEVRKSFQKLFTDDVPLALSAEGTFVVYGTTGSATVQIWDIAKEIEEPFTLPMPKKKISWKDLILPGDDYLGYPPYFCSLKHKQGVVLVASASRLAISPNRKLLASYALTTLSFRDFAPLDEEQSLGKAPLPAPLYIMFIEEGIKKNPVFSPDSRFVAALPLFFTEANVNCYDLSVAGDDKLVQFKGHQKGVEDAAFHPSSQVLASCGQDHSVRFWDPVNRKKLDAIQLGAPGMNLTHLLFTPDGKHLAVANDHGSIYLLQVSGHGLGSSSKSTAGPAKHTIKEVMKTAMKGGLAGKVSSFKASEEEKKELVDLFRSLHASTPPKGSIEEWQKLTGALLDSAERMLRGEIAAAELKKHVNCGNCHKQHKQ